MWKPDSADARPIWKQIGDHVRLLVASGRLPEGAPVPSVRQSAREMEVNPATVAKAYQRLVDADILEVRRGEGTYVRRLPADRAATLRAVLLREAAAAFVERAATLGFSAEEARSAATGAGERATGLTTEVEDD